MTLSRLFGVAPLAVFFDASATATVPATPRPFHDLEYRWDFGDPQSGHWRPTDGSAAGPSRNAAFGPIAAHVFERPGSYAVTLSVSDGTRSAVMRCAGITVQDPDQVFAGERTACFSNSEDFAGCPAGASRTVTSSFAAVTSAASAGNTVRRLLLRRGHAWSAPGPGVLRAPGPGLLAAFGPAGEPPPKVRGSHADGMLSLSSRETPGFADWRVADLDFDGERSTESKGVRALGGASRILLLRLGMRDVGAGVQLSSGHLDHWNTRSSHRGHAVWDQIAIVDSTIRDLHDGAGVYLSARRLAFLGNVVEDYASGTGHIARFPYVGKGVISNNTLSRPTVGLQVIKLHAPCIGGEGCPGVSDTEGQAYTEQVVISDNRLAGAERSWTVTLGPQSHRYNERLRDIIVERNWFLSGGRTQVALVVNASEVTARNNICDLTGAADGTCFDVFQRGPHAPPPAHVRIYNNTGYSSSAGGFTMVQLGTPNATASEVAVRNNLASAPHASSRHMVRDKAGIRGLSQSNNLLTDAPGFAGASPAQPADFRPRPGSPAAGAGGREPVLSDFFRRQRRQNVNLDLGALAAP